MIAARVTLCLWLVVLESRGPRQSCGCAPDVSSHRYPAWSPVYARPRGCRPWAAACRRCGGSLCPARTSPHLTTRASC
eukprot:3552147-Prymnesium_polylepis.2